MVDRTSNAHFKNENINLIGSVFSLILQCNIYCGVLSKKLLQLQSKLPAFSLQCLLITLTLESIF